MTKQKVVSANSPNARKFSMINIGIIHGLILFAPLFSEHLYRLDTLDALDKMVELRQAEELKSKLLFSIIVVSSEVKIRDP